ncbi:hypothetical protein DYBT9623_02133 [Dyadobacter sp. CECT 9623]|uniref:YD repeat-containing protein n=1 Tax=Dyadobacter linearis TaxID=2823330 RepID=A0ABN7R788_9BACT|nr:hypothetical protein [Dyadobacter sp. CECT 9623]CAG5069397.1 hypothetical protein DYBT9623_02133 [Dyadobacter sp. CECT 9623]
MKNISLLLTFALLVFSCKKDDVNPSAPHDALIRITAGDQLYQSFEYADGMLAKENLFGSCDTPYSIVNYKYQSGRLKSVEASARGTYSSYSGAMCDPNGTFESYKSEVEYDSQGRVSKVIRDRSTTEFEYKGRDVTEKISYDHGTGARIHHLKFDERGNLTEARTPDPVNGGIIRYEYDDKINPLHERNMASGSGYAFSGPNNPIKAFDAAGNMLWERKFEYNTKQLPTTCQESNGVTYSYHYQ